MENILLIVFVTLSVSFAAAYVSVLLNSRKLKKDLKKLFIENSLLQEYVNVTQGEGSKFSSEESIHKENFIKFLSDSRDWAYQYIEDVQKGLNSFINKTKPHVEYFDKYGEVGSAYPHYDSMKKISEEYKELIKLLPEEHNA